MLSAVDIGDAQVFLKLLHWHFSLRPHAYTYILFLRARANPAPDSFIIAIKCVFRNQTAALFQFNGPALAIAKRVSTTQGENKK